MTLTASSPIAGNTATNAGARTKLGANMDSFLKLLTAQLEHQDPLSPLDATQFTSQLVQFSTVEQAVETNTQLGNLTRLIQGNAFTSALGLIGLEARFVPSQVSLGATGGAGIAYELPTAAESVTATIRGADGAILRQLPAVATAGRHEILWDGLGADGQRAQPGVYGVEIRATEAAGKPLEVRREATGRVDGVETAGDGLRLSIGGMSVPLASVRMVQRPAAG